MTRGEARAVIVAAVEEATGAPGDSWSSGGVADLVLDALLDLGKPGFRFVDDDRGHRTEVRRTVRIDDDWKDENDA